MSRLRAIKLLRWLTLFAVMLQMGLALGHSHDKHQEAAFTVQGVLAVDDVPITRDGPVPHRDSDGCLLCLAVSLMASAVLPLLFLFAASAFLRAVLVPVPNVDLPFIRRRDLHTARGPPLIG